MVDRFELFVTSVNQIYRCVQKIKSREMTELGLKGPYVMCLFHLRKHPEGLTAAELSALCAEDKAATSRVISKLEEKGLVSLGDSGEKRRYRTKIQLTPNGSSIANKVTALIEAAVAKGGEGLSEEQRNIFYMALGVISNNLKHLSNGGESL